MKITTTLFRRLTKFGSITAAVLAMTTLSVRADQTAFNRILVFGDSLSDAGNFHAITGFPPAPYYDGRFSNGKLWVEYMADSLHMQIQSGDNFAIAGATTGRLNVNCEWHHDNARRRFCRARHHGDNSIGLRLQ